MSQHDDAFLAYVNKVGVTSLAPKQLEYYAGLKAEGAVKALARQRMAMRIADAFGDAAPAEAASGAEASAARGAGAAFRLLPLAGRAAAALLGV